MQQSKVSKHTISLVIGGGLAVVTLLSFWRGAPGRAQNSAVPVIQGLNLISTEDRNGGVVQVYQNDSTDYSATIDLYTQALRDSGYTSIGTTSGGGWNGFGGRQAWGYQGSSYVKVNAQVQQETGSVVYVCNWPTEPNDDDCGND